MKAFVRKLLSCGDWLLNGNREDETPGFLILTGMVAAAIFVVLTIPIWAPVWMLAWWSGYGKETD